MSEQKVPRSMEQRIVIKFLVAENVPSIEIHHRLQQVPFLQDNACPHSAKITVETLWKLKWNLLTHPPYSPDLALSDFYLFGRLKSDLQGMQFVDDAVIQTVREWTCRQPQAFFEKGIRMLPECWKKCVDARGEYVEG
ncbi:hypothetical protein B7P43_G15299 [Cryptotermes secundus]|uniref:Histone-lysine N-methyltransferase SETMAR n=1 Tax=Cryptotermes secundus TaxID=105785 RepID=A0A2J7PIQ5_9NEOP|nr:hypothetical protein B7P43_G15299 [Cryptotermes secundus]